MTRQTALEAAVAASAHVDAFPREMRLVEAQMLNEYGVFSKRHLSEICDLPLYLVEANVNKSTKVGGNFNPGTLPLLLDFANGYRQGVTDLSLLKTIIGQGTSVSFASKLLDIPKSTMQYWIR